MTTYDYLIVGSGLTGAVIARILFEAGRHVLVVERRSHLGGNVHDFHHPSGIRVHTYGPHYFRTGSEEVWDFVSRFADFYEHEAVVKSYVEGEYENWPIAESYIRRTVGENWEPEFVGPPTNFEEASLAMMPSPIYEKFVRGYTEKQWGVSANTLSAGLAGRFDVRADDDPRLKRCEYQGIPLNGYAIFMRNLLEDIPVILGVDYLEHKAAFKPHRSVIFTGPIDEFFGFRWGRLSYRSQRRAHTYLPDVDYFQPCGQVNNPDKSNGAHIRTLEWKHMMPQKYSERISGTLITREVPFWPDSPDRYEYPFPDEENRQLYRRYRACADEIPELLICGRLGEYRYYDMDQAIIRAIALAEEIL
jgi:UDP-galactopyranose mutase